MNSAALSPASLELAATLWPKSSFPSESAWLDYVARWFPKLESMNKILASK